MSSVNSIGKIIKEARVRAGWTQQNLAQEACISIATLQNIEADRANPAWDTLNSIFAALNLEVKINFNRNELEPFIPLGLPLLSQTARNLKPISHADFERIMKNGVDHLNSIRENSREEKALASFLWAIQDHFPSLWKKLDQRYKSWLRPKSDSARSIKLRRIALSHLGKIL